MWKPDAWLRCGSRNACQRKGNVKVFDLCCDGNHRFEGWFASSEEFDWQLNKRLLLCPLCGSSDIVRLPHATYFSKGRKEAPREKQGGSPQHYANLGAEPFAALIDRIIENTEDVGAAFPEEARKIHYREVPERHIRGTASPREVTALRDEGIEVVAVPIPVNRLGKVH
jgi:hypothetical protein